MYYKVPQIFIGGRFLRDCFHCYSQQIMSAVAKKSLIPYNFTKTAPETYKSLNNITLNATPKPNQTSTMQQWTSQY